MMSQVYFNPYKKTAYNSCIMNTYETKDLKLPRMNTYKKPGGGGPPLTLLALFCSLQELNIPAFMFLCTLSKKHRGWG